MDATHLAMRLIIDGYVVVPDVVIGEELMAMRAAFEACAARTGRRHLDVTDVERVPELVNYLGHPRLLPVIDAYQRHFGHEPAAANLMLARDIFDPAQPVLPAPDIVNNPQQAELHNDGHPTEFYRLSFDVLNVGCATLLYLDETYPDAGCIIQAVGSHHLSYRAADGTVVSPSLDLVRQVCRFEYVGVKPGSVVIQRAFNWHTVGPAPRHHRRTLRCDYTPKALYDAMDLDRRNHLHQQFSDEMLRLLPVERHRLICRHQYACV